MILFQSIWWREGINQKEAGINIKPSIVLIQFNDKLKFVDGSNLENKFAIIFS